MHITLRKQRIPEQGEKRYLAGWILRSLGINPKEQGSVVRMLLEIAEKRKEKKGVSGKKLLELSGIGKTQTYHWLKRLEEIGLLCKGKKKLIEHGGEYTLKGYYLSGKDLKDSLKNTEKKVSEIIVACEKVAGRLEGVIEREEIPETKKPEIIEEKKEGAEKSADAELATIEETEQSQ